MYTHLACLLSARLWVEHILGPRPQHMPFHNTRFGVFTNIFYTYYINRILYYIIRDVDEAHRLCCVCAALRGQECMGNEYRIAGNFVGEQFLQILRIDYDSQNFSANILLLSSTRFTVNAYVRVYHCSC